MRLPSDLDGDPRFHQSPTLPLASFILIKRLTEPIAAKLRRFRRTGTIAWLSLVGLAPIAGSGRSRSELRPALHRESDSFTR